MEERPQEATCTQRTGPGSLFKKLYQPGPLIALFSMAFIALVSLGYFLLTEKTPPPEVITPETVETVAPTPRAYEEDTSSELEDKVKQADLAIIETMKAMRMSMAELGLLDVEIRQFNGKGYHYQVIQLPAAKNQSIFHKHLQAALATRLPEASIQPLGKQELGITIDSHPTHRLILKTMELAVPAPSPKGPKMVIVIDDIGENMSVLKGLLKLDFPVTLAVWPNATHTRESVKLIQKSQRDLIIHFPMEPRGYPRYNPGDDALFVSMTREQIEKRIAENIAQIPEAIGANNHMGSRFTANTSGMNVALAAFKKHGLFFLDSLTTGKSVGRTVAGKTGIPFYIRDIFIDNVKDVNAIVHQLRKAENVSLKKGYSIAIGHPYKETLAALRQWSKTKKSSVVLIPLSELSPE